MPDTVSTGEIVRKAHAKLNVFLRVIGRRPDGYHDIETLVIPLSLHDVVTVREAGDLAVRFDEAAPGDLPGPGENLALAAALALRDAAAPGRGAEISIDKRIPIAAGLGGGSADAAAVLIALNELWGCGLDDPALASIGSAIGSDVPAMLAGGPVLASGRGEVLVPVHTPPTTWVLKPFDFGVRAADAYGWWDEAGGTTGPDPGVLIASLEIGNVELVGDAIFDDLQGPVAERHPAVGEAVDALRAAGAEGAVMSGSGPTVVALARTANAAAVAAAVPGAFVVTGSPGSGVG